MAEWQRRDFLGRVTAIVGGIALSPLHVAIVGCGGAKSAERASGAGQASRRRGMYGDPKDVPLRKPKDWDPLRYNLWRANAGAVPSTYLDDLNGPEGTPKHLGKHLPFIPRLPSSKVPAGFLPLMWGDPRKGYTRHPNARRTEKNDYEGHWFDWIQLRRASGDNAEETRSTYSNWPHTTQGDSGAFTGYAGPKAEHDDGRNTVYLAALPRDVRAGDDIRVWGHCLTHGEYVDFLRYRG